MMLNRIFCNYLQNFKKPFLLIYISIMDYYESPSPQAI